MRRLIRLSLAVPAVLFGALWIHAAVALDRMRGRHALRGAGRRAQASWCRLFCRLFGVRVVVCGELLSESPILLVANHVSWLDILCLAGRWPMAFLSKSEVRGWPVVGRVATALGTLYIERGRRRAAERAVAGIRRRLQEGHRVLLFPEGTTTDGSTLLPFRPRLLQAAVDAGVPVQTVAISYHYPDGERCTRVAFVDDQGLLDTVRALAALPALEARLTVGPALGPGSERTPLARDSREQILQALGLAAPDRGGPGLRGRDAGAPDGYPSSQASRRPAQTKLLSGR